jgi:beclin
LFVQLDASLVDLAPSAFDTIVAALPPQASPLPHPADGPSKLAALPAHPSVKDAWQRSYSSTDTLSLRAQGKLPTKAYSAPNESFVVLQDSVVHYLPSSPPPISPTRKRVSLRMRSPTAPAGPVPHPTDVQQPNPSPLTHHLRSTARLFNLLSTRTEIDYPLCAECTQILRSTLQRQLDEVKKERDGYLAFEKEARKERDRQAQGLSKEIAESKITQLEAKEADAIDQLKAAERERAGLEEELRHLEEEDASLEEEEIEFVNLSITPGAYADHDVIQFLAYS